MAKARGFSGNGSSHVRAQVSADEPPERLARCPLDYLATARIHELLDGPTTMTILPKHRFVLRTTYAHLSNNVSLHIGSYPHTETSTDSKERSMRNVTLTSLFVFGTNVFCWLRQQRELPLVGGNVLSIPITKVRGIPYEDW